MHGITLVVFVSVGADGRVSVGGVSVKLSKIRKMPVVNYSSSDSDDETIQKSVPSSSGNKRRKVISEKPGKAVTQMPSLPNSFLDLYATNVRTGTADDPTLHGGRKRAIPHIDGNWQTHVYLECMYCLTFPTAYRDNS